MSTPDSTPHEVPGDAPDRPHDHAHDTPLETAVTETPTRPSLVKPVPPAGDPGRPTAGTPTAGTPTAGTPTAGTPTAGTPTSGAPEPAPRTPDVVVEEPVGPALGTIVWGCTALAVAALLGAWEVAEVRVDLGLVVPVGMVLIGLLLVVGAVVAAVRQRR